MSSQPQCKELLALPNELLDHIIEATLPSEFQNFMLTCKVIYKGGSRFIPYHNEQKKLWSEFGVDDDEDAASSSPRGMTALGFIHRVALKDGLVPAYIKELNFGYGGAILTSRSLDLDRQMLEARTRGRCKWWHNKTTVQQMRDLVTRSRYLRTSGVDVEDWANKMFDMNPGDGAGPSHAFQMHTLVFILTLLVNVSKIHLSTWSWTEGLRLLNENPGSDDGKRYPELRQVLHYIACNANEYNRGDREGETAALSKLKSLVQTEISPNDNPSMPACCYKPFLALDTLNYLYSTHPTAVEVDPSSRFSYTPFQPPPPPPPTPTPPSTLVSLPRNPSLSQSGLQHLCLVYSDLCPTSFERFLAYAAPRLEYLELECDDYSYHEGKRREGSWDIGALIAVLGRTSGTSLTALDLRPMPLYGETNGVVPIRSLREFERLEKLEIPAFCFLGVKPEDKVVKKDGALYARWVEGIEAVPRLKDILPPSLKTLDLLITQFEHWERIMSLPLLKALLLNFNYAESGLSRFTISLEHDYGVGCERRPDNSPTSDALRRVAGNAGVRFHCSCETCSSSVGQR